MGNYKQILKNLKNDMYDDRTCYAEALNAITAIDPEDYKDGVKVKEILTKVDKYFDQCTCDDESLNRVLKNLSLLEEEKKQGYIEFFDQINSEVTNEISKCLKGEKHQFSKETSLTNSKPFANNIINEIFATLTKADGSFLEDIFENDNATLLKAHVEEDETLLYISNDGLGSLLHYAAYHNSVNILNYLNEFVKHYNGLNNSGSTPLHIAYSRGNIEAIDFLIEHGADESITTPEDGFTPRNMATLVRTYEEAKKLFENGYVTNYDVVNSTAILTALHSHRNGCLIYLLENEIIKYDYQIKEGTTLLYAAIYFANEEIVTYLHKKGVDLFSGETDAPNWIYALQTGNEAIISMFLEDERLHNLSEEDIDNMLAFSITNTKVFEKVKKLYPSYEKHLKSVYEVVINENLFDSLDYMIENNENINVQVAEYHSVLSFATNMNSEEVIRKLMNKESVLYSNEINAPFVFFLARNLMFDLIDEAINLGADPTIAPEGASLFYQTIYQNPDVSTIKKIYELDNRVSRENTNGYTPLIVATLHGNIETCKFLLEKGAKPYLKSQGLKVSAFDLAKKNKKKELIKLYKKHK